MAPFPLTDFLLFMVGDPFRLPLSPVVWFGVARLIVWVADELADPLDLGVDFTARLRTGSRC